MPPLSKTDISAIQGALSDARAGRATLKQLAHAHDVAVGAEPSLPGTIGELREHIRSNTPSPPHGISAGKAVGLGVVAGVISNLIMRLVLPPHVVNKKTTVVHLGKGKSGGLGRRGEALWEEMKKI